MLRKLLLGICSLLLVWWIGGLLAPRWVAHEVHERYPFVTVGYVELTWNNVRLYKVHLEHPLVSGDLDFVDRDWRGKETIIVSGGDLVVTLPPAEKEVSSSGGSSLPAFHATNIRSLLVKKGDSQAVLKDVIISHSGTSKQVAFKQADISALGLPQVTVTGGQVSMAEALEGHLWFTADQIVAHKVSLPIELPRVEKSMDVTLSKVDATFFKDLDKIWEPDEGKTIKIGHVKIGSVLELDVVDLFLAPTSLRALAVALRVNHPWIQLEPAEFVLILVTIPRPLEGPLKVSIGGNPPIEIEVDPFKYSVKGSGPCSAWREGLPTPLPSALESMPSEALTGTIDFSAQVKPKPTFKVNFSCKFDCSKEPMASFSRGNFSYEPYHADGTRFVRKTGFNLDEWSLITDIPPHVGDAFIRLEDPSFLKHRGIVPSALEVSFLANVKAGTFTKGGSTISMQLAKNLWLPRHKTLMRKVHEAFLATALESCYSKAEILETYLNIIEFGPDVYGIKAAANYYFDKEPQQLRSDEAYYLASILPKPLKAKKPEYGGLAQAQRIMTYLAEHGFISDDLIDFGDSAPLKTQGWETATN